MGNTHGLKDHSKSCTHGTCPKATNAPADGVANLNGIYESDELVKDIIEKRKFADKWEVSPRQKMLLRECWESLRANLESVGVVTFLKLFETHPETLRPFIHDVYSVKELELNEWYREKLKVHALRVMAVVEKTMHRLDNEVKAGQILIPYGKRHKGYGVTLEMLDIMSQSFLVAIQPTLEDKSMWNREYEEAWQALFRFINFFLKLGYGGMPVIMKHYQLPRTSIVPDDAAPGQASD